MNTGNHTIHALFEQLGLESSETSVQRFLHTQAPLPANIRLYQASIWNSSQALFLQEAINQDSDWSNAADQLDAILRQIDMNHRSE